MWYLKLLLILFSTIDKGIPEPKFGAGYPVNWSDGSKGVILKVVDYHDSDWYYLVHLKYIDWQLPEKGLTLRENFGTINP